MFDLEFFLNRKTDDKSDECLVAQEKMHPACAQRVELAEMPTCHSLAEVCREDKACRYAQMKYSPVYEKRMSPFIVIILFLFTETN